MAKLAELPESMDPHTIVRFSTSDEVLRLPNVIRLYDERNEAPGSDTHAANKNAIFLDNFKSTNQIIN
jgi:hypothetical protein